MKKIDLYEIAIKISGLYLVIVIIDQLRSLLIFIPASFQQNGNTPDTSRLSIFLGMCSGLIILIVFVWLLVFRTKKIAKFITKPSDTKEEVRLFAEKKTIFEICLVLLGLIMIVWTLPDLIVRFKNYITAIQTAIPINDDNKMVLIISGVKIITGLLAIVYSGQLAGLLSEKELEQK